MSNVARVNEVPRKASRLKKCLRTATAWLLLTVSLLLWGAGAPALAKAASTAAAQKESSVSVESAPSHDWKWLGKAPLTAEQVQEILAAPKGERPDPATYLDKKYMQRHLKQFRQGVSFVMGLDNYVMYVLTRKSIGREDGSCFVMPKIVCDDIAKKARGDISVYEQALGFEPGYFQGHGGLVRIDVTEVADLHVRIPSGNEAGANAYWLPGGYTSGGVPEAVSDLIPKARIHVTRLQGE